MWSYIIMLGILAKGYSRENFKVRDTHRRADTFIMIIVTMSSADEGCG